MKVAVFALMALMPLTAAAQAANTLTQTEAAQGWKLLWDGKTGNGWHTATGSAIPNAGWVIQDGVLTVLSSGGHGHGKGGDLLTDGDYGNFELSFDFKVTPGANSGVKYFVNPNRASGGDPSIGFEYQLLDDDTHPDAKLGRNGDRKTGSLYDLIAPGPNTHVHPVGEWNTGKIVVRGAHGEQWLNGEKVVEYERFTPEFRKLVAESKYKDLKGFGELHHGHIFLQDHGDSASFRNIKLRELGPEAAGH